MSISLWSFKRDVSKTKLRYKGKKMTYQTMNLFFRDLTPKKKNLFIRATKSWSTLNQQYLPTCNHKFRVSHWAQKASKFTWLLSFLSSVALSKIPL